MILQERDFLREDFWLTDADISTQGLAIFSIPEDLDVDKLFNIYSQDSKLSEPRDLQMNIFLDPDYNIICLIHDREQLYLHVLNYNDPKITLLQLNGYDEVETSRTLLNVTGQCRERVFYKIV